jgi:sulfonate transport system permease protein
VTAELRIKALPLERSPRATTRFTRPGRILLRFLVPLIVLAVWQVTTTGHAASSGYHLPSPADVAEGFRQLWQNGQIEAAIPTSLARAGIGFALGIAIGIPFGVLDGLFNIFESLFDTTFQIVRVIPFLALVPLFEVWFGIGEGMKIILIAVASVFPVYINTCSAVRLVDPKLVEAGQTFSLSRPAIILKVVLPLAWPSILVGIRYSMGVALLALIIAESVNSNAGIGDIIYVAQNAFRIDLMMVGILLYAALGVVIDVVMRLIERYSTPWLTRSK